MILFVNLYLILTRTHILVIIFDSQNEMPIHESFTLILNLDE